MTKTLNTKEKIPVEISAHHVHLSQKDIDELFGKGYTLTKAKDLSQPGQFSCRETVDVVGPKATIRKVRVLGPPRENTQIEVARTEQYKLGIHIPYRLSGDVASSPGVLIRGSSGELKLEEGLICAVRHIHMNPAEAQQLGVDHGYVVMVKIKGSRELIFGDVVVRVHPEYNLRLHIDTDEGNAAGVTEKTMARIVQIQNTEGRIDD